MKLLLVFVSLSFLSLSSCKKNYSCNCTTVTYIPEYCDVCPAGTIVGMIPEETLTTEDVKYVNERNLSDAENSCAEIGMSDQTFASAPPNNQWNSIPVESLSDSIRTVVTCTVK